MPSIQEQSSANNQCAQGSPSGAGRTEKSQKEEMAMPVSVNNTVMLSLSLMVA